MKEKEFDLNEYSYIHVARALRSILKKADEEFNSGEVKIKISSLVDIHGIGFGDDINTCLSALDTATANDVIEKLKQRHAVEKAETVRMYNEKKKECDKILFDDKDYQELVGTLDDLYYCQALSMLSDILKTKTNGKSAKALKYQSRLLAMNNTATCN